MIVDIDQVDSLPLAARYDVCIAGGGVAGIVLATTLAERGQRVLVLEAGGLDFSEDSQAVYGGDIVGRDYFDLDTTRLRYLGGTSNHWAGLCRPLDAHDFEKRDYIDGSGWPIDIGDLQQYLPEALRIMEIAAFQPEPALSGSNGMLKEVFLQRSPPVRFGEKYRDALASSDAIDVFLNANLVDIVRDTANGQVSSFVFRGYDNEKPSHKAAATRYILALGGLETPRVLLNANRQVPQGLGNENDLVGRYFMEHPHHTAGYYVLDTSKARFGEHLQYISPSAELQRREGIGSAGFRVMTIDEIDDSFTANAKELAMEIVCANDAVREFVDSFRPISCRPNKSGLLRVGAEQVPNANSRVKLSTETDRFGLRRVALDWRLLPQDKKTIRVATLEIAKYFARADIGRVKINDWLLDEDDPGFPGLDDGAQVGGHHHMGTTRMGVSAQDGVVDRNCRVFGVDNLYVAGSSVFRTGGHANPTLSIVQLALRLRDHLAPPA